MIVFGADGDMGSSLPLHGLPEDIPDSVFGQDSIAAVEDQRAVYEVVEHVFCRTEFFDVEHEAEFLHPGLHAFQAGCGDFFIASCRRHRHSIRLWRSGRIRQTVFHDEAVIRQGHGRERHAVRGIRAGADGLAQHVDHPVRRFPLGDERVQSPGGVPHQIGACFVIRRIDDGFAAGFDDIAHEAFGQIVAGIVVFTGKILSQM